MLSEYAVVIPAFSVESIHVMFDRYLIVGRYVVQSRVALAPALEDDYLDPAWAAPHGAHTAVVILAVRFANEAGR